MKSSKKKNPQELLKLLLEHFVTGIKKNICIYLKEVGIANDENKFLEELKEFDKYFENKNIPLSVKMVELISK